MARLRRHIVRGPTSLSASMISVVGLIVCSTVVVDPLGFQSFLLLRYAAALGALLIMTVIMWRKGVALPTQRSVRIAFPALLLLLFTSTLLARSPLVAFLGASGRQLGWLAWVLFAVAFVAGLSLFDRSEGEQIESALAVGFSIAIIGVGAIAALEAIGAPLVEVNQQFGSRMQASFGNPSVLGAFVVLGLPIVVAGCFARRFRMLARAASVTGAALLILSGARGAWIGLVVGAVFSGIVIRSRRGGIGAARIAAVVAVIVVLLGLTAVTGRWATAASGLEGRVATWRIAGAVVSEHPVVGVGPEGFATAFAEEVDDDYVIRYTRDGVVDRAHNGLLEVATAAGVAGLVAYLVLLAGVLTAVWKAAMIGDEVRPVIVGASAGVVAYLVQQQVFFQLAALDLTFWLVVGLLTCVAGLATGRHRMPFAAVVMLIVVGVASVYAAIGVIADHGDRAALRPGDVQTAMLRLESAASLRPSDDIHAVLAAGIARESHDANANASAGRLVNRALEIDPSNETLILERSALLVDVYQISGAVSALDAAQADLEELIERDRTNGAAFLRLGAIAFYRGDYDTARTRWTRAAHLMPHRTEPIDNLRILEGQKTG